ncbi:hypothetical protein Hte_005194 [Hypoxylon texense]
MKAIGSVFRRVRSPAAPIYVGSVKANIGHLEGGSGLAGILKCVMILEKGVIPPNPLFEKLNIKINAKQNNIQVPTSCILWPSTSLRRISVNSFGFGGSNGHVIMDDAYHTLEALIAKDVFHLSPLTPTVVECEPIKAGNARNDIAEERVAKINSAEVNGMRQDIAVLGSSENPKEAIYTPIDGSIGTTTLNRAGFVPVASGTAPSDLSDGSCKHQLLVYSARDQAALKRVLKQYSKYYDDCVLGSTSKLHKLAYTLAARRSLMAWRAFTVGKADLKPEAILNSSCMRPSLKPEICFVFTGQGAQYSKMGLELLQYPVFASTLSQANDVFQELGAHWSLLDRIESGEEINLPQFSQPLCTALQIALVELLKSFNVTPSAVVGHSSGEIGAAYAIGALSLESACMIAYHRGRLSGQLASSTCGAMMSANLQEKDVHAYVNNVLPDGEIHIACVNSPSNVTLAGAEADINALKDHLDNDGVFAQKLETGVAYHTPVMQQIAQEYLSCLDLLGCSVPDDITTPMVSSVTGQKVAPSELSTAQYWVDNLTSPVRFADALQYLTQAAPKLDRIKTVTDYLEIGPHGALRRPVVDTLSNYTESRYASVLSKFNSPLETTMEVAGQLFSRGYPVSITAVNQQGGNIGPSSFLVDLPRYPFDHSRQYWHESRLSRDWRLRGAAPRSILGIRSSDWNPLEPKWRKMLSVEEEPWIADHVVDGTIVFPAAGMIVMALEAVKQTVQTQQTISGYLIKEATFAAPISIQPEEKTEVLTRLRAMQDAYERTSLRFEVVVFVLDNDSWKECFKAVIHAKLKEVPTEVDRGLEARAAKEELSSSFEQARRLCTNPVTKQSFYKWLDKQKLSYGDAFALAEDIFWDGNDLCIARVDISSLSGQYEGVVHPAVLDNCLQICCTAPSEGMLTTLSTFIPHQMRDTLISATGWQYPQTCSIRIQTWSKLNTSLTGIKCSFTTFADDGSLLCQAKHVGMSAVSHNESTGEGRALLHSIDWKPQLSLLTADQLSDYCKSDEFLEDETAAVDYCVRLENALHAYLERKLSRLQQTINEFQTPTHIKQFVSWIDRQLEKRQTKVEISDQRLDEEMEALRMIKPSWRIFLDVAQALPSIVRGETDALELLFSTPLAQDLYDEFFHRTCNHKLFSYLELAAHQTPTQKILEVGAGTGGMTNRILSMLRKIEDETGGTAFSEYVYTDVSTAYFEGASERFADYGDRITFKTLDLERDVGAQGFEPNTYDVIIAGSVLHATTNLSATLRNLRLALKPGGQLIFLEVTAPGCFVTSFGFGILPGWWCGEEESRAWCPTVTEAKWDALLRDNGFSGNDLIIRDYKDERARYVSIIVTSADTPSHAVVGGLRVLIVVDDQDEDQRNLALELVKEGFNFSDYRPVVFALSQVADAEVCLTDHVLYLADMGKSLLAEPSEETFQLIQRWVQQSKQLLWITASSISHHHYPYTGLKDGLLRVIRSENNSKRIVSLSFENDTSDKTIFVQHIAQTFKSAFEAASPDTEYVVRDGKVLTGRLIQEVGLNKDLNSSIHPQVKHEAWLPGPALKFDVGTRGSLDTLRFIEDHDYNRELGPMDIEIEIQAWAIGFRDVFAALGRLDENEFGTDCAGVVKRVGTKCTKICPGDRVCTSQFGCMRTYVRANELDAIKVPESLSMEEACGVLNPGMTAWYSLIDVAQLQKGEKILIHAASGATGQVAIQIAQMVGAEIFATVGYDHKKHLLINDYGIPESHIFYSRDLSFAQGVMRVTGGYGVDVVLNSLVGEGLRESWELGATSEAAIRIVHELTEQGVYIATPRCDVTVADSLQRVLEDYGPAMGPIRGCVNATMVLQDSIFDNITHAQWESTIRSKVLSSWNLHTLLPTDLEFFILLSSASGTIGNAGQSNYAAGCTFQDSLSQYRVGLGQKAVSIDLGPMRTLGVVAENEALKRTFEKYQGLTQVEEEEFVALLDILCDPGYYLSASMRSQVTMGIVTPADILAQDASDMALEHMHRSLFARFSHAKTNSSKTGSGNSINYAALFRQAGNTEKMIEIVTEALVRKVARALSVQPEDVDIDKPLHLYGVDSLVAVEIRNWIRKEFAADVPIFELMSGKTISTIGQLITRSSQIKEGP